MHTHSLTFLTFFLMTAFSQSAVAQNNCDLLVVGSNGTTACESRPDAQFGRIDSSRVVVSDRSLVPPSQVLGCNARTRVEAMDREGLTEAQRAVLNQFTQDDGVLIDATIDGQRYLYVAPFDAPIGWSPNPDRVDLRLPGSKTSGTYLVDGLAGPARYCAETKIFSVTANAPLAASVQIESTPPTQEVTAGSTAFIQIKITNNGTVTLAPLSVSSSVISQCARNISSLGAGYYYSYTCSKGNVQAAFSNTVVATGTHAGGSVSATATSVVTLPGGGEPPGSTTSALFSVCRLPWMQYAKPGQQAYWQISVANTSGRVLNNVSISDPQVAGCSTTYSSIGIDQTVLYNCSATVPNGTSGHYYTTTGASTPPGGGASVPEMTVTNGVITDFIFVNGMDGCVLGGSSADFCQPSNTYHPMLRRPN